jgi:hypothetical protein
MTVLGLRVLVQNRRTDGRVIVVTPDWRLLASEILRKNLVSDQIAGSTIHVRQPSG